MTGKPLFNPCNQLLFTKSIKMERSQKQLRELNSEKYYKSSKSPWFQKEREFWKLYPGSRHPVEILASGDGYRKQPYSEIKVIIDNDDTYEKFSAMRKSLNETYKRLSANCHARLVKPQSKNLFVVFQVKRQDGEVVFRRGRILRRVSDGTYRVYAFDDDVVCTVKQEDLFKMKTEFLEFRPLVVSVFLEGLEHMTMFPVFQKIVRAHLDPDEEFEYEPSSIDVELFKNHTVGTFYDSKGHNVNYKIAYEFFGQPCVSPEIQNVNLQCRIMYAWNDGTVSVQFDLAVLDQIRYILEVEKRRLANSSNRLKKRSSITILPDTRYAVGNIDLREGASMIWRRGVMLEDDERVVTPDEIIDCYLIDYGYKVSVPASQMVLLKEKHPFLHLIPMQCVPAQLAYVKELDSKRFMSERVLREPAWIALHKRPETEDDLPQITLYTRGISQRRKKTKTTSLRAVLPLLFANKMAVPIDPFFGGNPYVKKKAPSPESSGIVMKNLQEFVEPSMRTRSLKEINTGCKIQFKVIEVRSETDFVIQTLRAEDILRDFELSKPTKRVLSSLPPAKPYSAIPVEDFDIVPGRLFLHMCSERLKTMRVKICEPKETDLSARASVNVLQVDYANYVRVEVDELITPPIGRWDFVKVEMAELTDLPGGPRDYGPQAALLTHSELDPTEDIIGKRFMGTISHLEYDDYDLALIQLEAASVVEL